jgi:uncharacterized membrane protein
MQISMDPVKSLTEKKRFAEGQITVPARTVTLPSSQGRLFSIDALRGLVMILMVLDHTRIYFHADALLFDPTDLTKTNPILFMTRWLTHFCAPVFVFLAGTGVFLSLSYGKPKKEIVHFLVTRGLWLVILELTLIHFFWEFNFNFLNASILWVLGWSMVILAGLIFLPHWIVIFGGILTIASHNLFDGVRSDSFGLFHWLWTILHHPGRFEVVEGLALKVRYPLIPWVGVMAVGFGFGKLWLLERTRRRPWMLSLGVFLTLLFVFIRITNSYGDPRPWLIYQNGWWTFFSFINLEKYPPSLLYLLATLGPAIIILALFDQFRAPGILIGPLAVFGQVPLFFYMVHLFLIHAWSVISVYVEYGQTPVLDHSGYDLPVVYLVWLAVVVMLYPVCRWFTAFKKHRSRDHKWLSYL